MPTWFLLDSYWSSRISFWLTFWYPKFREWIHLLTIRKRSHEEVQRHQNLPRHLEDLGIHCHASKVKPPTWQVNCPISIFQSHNSLSCRVESPWKSSTLLMITLLYWRCSGRFTGIWHWWKVRSCNISRMTYVDGKGIIVYVCFWDWIVHIKQSTSPCFLCQSDLIGT